MRVALVNPLSYEVRALRTLCEAGAIRRTGRSRFAVASAARLRALALPRG